MPDLKLSDMLDMQRVLWEKHRDKWSPMEPEFARNSILWMMAELGEVIDIIKKRGEEDIISDPGLRAGFVEELADTLMYFLDVLLRYGVTAGEFSRAFQSKYEKNMKRDFVSESAAFRRAGAQGPAI